VSVGLHEGDCRSVLAMLPAESVQCCVTSPPYLNLRSYLPDSHPDKALEIGSEPSPAEYVAALVEVFREVKRVLRKDGTLWLNLGSSYASRAMFSQRMVLREDLTDDQRRRVWLGLRHLWLDADEEASQRALPEMLHGGISGQALRCESREEAGRVSDVLREQAHRNHQEDDRVQSGAEAGDDRGIGREMRLLRRDGAGVFDDGSHQERRRGAQNENDREEQGKLSHDIQGREEKRLAKRRIPGALLELQLGEAHLRLLSALSLEKDVIHSDIVGYFRHEYIIKPKDDLQIPARVAMALQADGFYLRSEIIWSKSAPMPESVRDRPTCAHEKVWLLTKAATYFYDAAAVAEPASEANSFNGSRGRLTLKSGADGDRRDGGRGSIFGNGTRNLRNVWHLNPEPFAGSHFATMPATLAERCIKAGSRPGDTVLDPFAGAGTTLMVADRLQRHAVGIELNPEYAQMARSRLTADAPLFCEVA